jgi:sigma-B regulation protein RsbU (phosphoserine phosphatase)
MQKFFRQKSAGVLSFDVLRGQGGWVGLLFVNLIIVLSLRNELISPRISGWVPQLALNLYLLVIYIFGQLKIKQVERYNFMQLIWKMFLCGLLAVALSFFVEAVYFMFADTALAQTSFAINLVYLLSLAIIATYLVLLLIAFKRLVLYEKSRVLLITWRIFEYSLISSMLLGIFNIQVNTLVYDGILLALVGMGLLLSVNLKWVGYLDLNQKWRSLLMLLGIVGCIAYFSFFGIVYRADTLILLNVADNLFLLALLAFCLFYSLLSCLVIFFNLPTSSVYEKKWQEVQGFYRLNRISTKEEREETVLSSLLENSVSAIDAVTGWIEMGSATNEEVQLLGNIEENELNEILQSIRKPGLRKVFSLGFCNEKGREYFVGGLQHPEYRSMLVVPLNIQEQHSGLLVLLKDVEGAFNKDAIDLVKAYADQGCGAIENSRLLREALQNERYKEEVAIARRVQRSLLPEELAHNHDFELAVYSESADEVGGDYYDTYQLDENRFVLIIADVAGHGTTAAFAMSQLKGVFHSLVQLGLSGKEFVEKTNGALSKCLDKATFVTLTYIEIDTARKQMALVRAGHCPALFYRKAAQSLQEFQQKGLGIGIIRNEQYGEQLEEIVVKYQPGDLMVLYTDGLLESKNERMEEFGVERLRTLVKENAEADVLDLQNKIISALRGHVEKAAIDDDFTTMLVKFC